MYVEKGYLSPRSTEHVRRRLGRVPFAAIPPHLKARPHHVRYDPDKVTLGTDPETGNQLPFIPLDQLRAGAVTPQEKKLRSKWINVLALAVDKEIMAANYGLPTETNLRQYFVYDTQAQDLSKRVLGIRADSAYDFSLVLSGPDIPLPHMREQGAQFVSAFCRNVVIEASDNIAS